MSRLRYNSPSADLYIRGYFPAGSIVPMWNP